MDRQKKRSPEIDDGKDSSLTSRQLVRVRLQQSVVTTPTTTREVVQKKNAAHDVVQVSRCT